MKGMNVTPSFAILSACLLFAGTHLWMSASNLRETLTPRIGNTGFTVTYLVVTITTMSTLIATVAYFGHQGVKGIQIADPLLRLLLQAGSGLGTLFVVAGLASFPKSPMSTLAQRVRTSHHQKALRPPAGVERVTRHPFFVGLAMLSFCHLFLASTLATGTLFAGLMTITLVGIPLQDRKLRNRWGDVYAEYERRTSIVPFGQTRNQPDRSLRSEYLAWFGFLIVTVVAFGALHSLWTFANGAGFLVLVLVYGATGGILGILRGTKKRRQS